MESAIKITRETEFYQGYIRFKMAVTNESPYSVLDISLDFIYDADILRIDCHEPQSLPVKQGKYVLGNIDAGKSKSIAIYFDPLMCSKGTDIGCDVTFKDHMGKRIIEQMASKEISVVCPIMKTDSDINIGRLKEFIGRLPSQDSRVCEVLSGFDMDKLVTIAREVVEKHDIRHVRTLHTKDDNNYELWYYGKTKVTKDDIVIRFSILNTSHTVELFAATQNAETLTGLLAEIGRELKNGVESRVSGKGRVVNVSINKSKIERSNLLDLCNMDGTCDVNIVIDKSEINRSSIGSSGGNECPVCFNVIDSSNKSLLCKKCGAKFCEACESWFREERKPGDRPLCEKCFTEKRELLRKENEKKELLRRQQEASSAPKKPAYTPTKRPSLPEKEQKSGFNGIIAVILLILLFGGLLLILLDNSNDSGNQNTVVPKSTEVIDYSLAAAEATADKTTVFAGPQDGDNTYTNSIGMEFVLIPAGKFAMGSDDVSSSEKPVHEVTIGQAYYLGKYEVTQAQWVEIMGDNPSYFDGDNNPVEQVSWNDVQEFVEKLNAKEGTDKYRLPSEAEWEYACRAGTTTRYSFGGSVSSLGEYAWYGGYDTYEEWEKNDGKILTEGSTHPVGQKKPNPWGLYDMHGNVWEWCQDWYHDSYNGAPTDGSAWEDGSSSNRVRRGGGWLYGSGDCRSAVRLYIVPDYRSYVLGFRLLRTV